MSVVKNSDSSKHLHWAAGTVCSSVGSCNTVEFDTAWHARQFNTVWQALLGLCVLS